MLTDTDIRNTFELFSAEKHKVIIHSDTIRQCLNLTEYFLAAVPVVHGIEYVIPPPRNRKAFITVGNAGGCSED